MQCRINHCAGLDSAEGAYSIPPDSLAGFKGPTSKEKGEEGKVEERRGWQKRGEKGPRLALVWGPGMVNPALILCRDMHCCPKQSYIYVNAETYKCVPLD